MEKVLVTGASGFLGSHTIIQLLNKGYAVTGTLRDINRSAEIATIIKKHVSNDAQLHFVAADLTDATIWTDLTKGMDYVQHIASPFPRELPKHEDELIIPARDGVLNLLKAASINKVKRFVLTSSDAAVVYGKKKTAFRRLFNESDWTDLAYEKDLTAYVKSKAIAEKVAWEFIETDTSGMELTTILPGAILGPVLEEDFGTSANLILKMFDGSMPMIPRLGYPIADVRSVAEALISGMEMTNAAGNRYIASNGFAMMKDIADILRKAYPDRKIPKRELPNFLLRIFSKFDPALQPTLINLGVKRAVDNQKLRTELDWNPKPMEEAILSCAESLFKIGIIK